MYLKNKNIVSRKISDSYFLIDITENYIDEKCRLFEVNEIGMFIWKNVDNATSMSDITKVLLDNINDEVRYDEIYTDVSEFLDMLCEQRFVKVV